MTIFKISRLKTFQDISTHFNTFQDISSHSGSLLTQSWYHQQDLVADLELGPPFRTSGLSVPLIVSLGFVRAKVGRWVIWKMGEVVVNYSQLM